MCLPIFLERLRNEITRLTTVKALTKVAASPLRIDLRPIMVRNHNTKPGLFFIHIFVNTNFILLFRPMQFQFSAPFCVRTSEP